MTISIDQDHRRSKADHPSSDKVAGPIITSSNSLNAGKKPFYRPEFDLLRFFAFFAVFCHHAISPRALPIPTRDLPVVSAIFESLNSAVSLFFFLSAYLITCLLELEYENTGSIHIAAFYVRRVLRIWPLFYGYLVFCLLLTLLHTIPMNLGLFETFAFFIGNLWISHAGFLAAGPLAILWSVCIEEQFYAVCPLTLKLFKLRGLAYLSAILILLSWAALIRFGLNHDYLDDHLRPATIVQLQFFAAGTLTALFLRYRKIGFSNVTRLLLASAGCLCWMSAAIFFSGDRTNLSLLFAGAPLLQFLLVLAGCLAIFFAFHSLPIHPSLQPLITLGKISYGLYLFHPLSLQLIRHEREVLLPHQHSILVQLATVLIAFGLSIALALLSYKFYEAPFLSLKQRFSFVQNRSVKL